MAKTDIKIDHEFQALIPPLAPDELAQLEASLLADGCRDPLIVWNGHGLLLDGHNRKRICDKHDIPYKLVEIDLPDREAAKAFIVKNQLARRNLSPEAASYLRGQRYLELKQQGKRSDLKKKEGGEKAAGTSGQSDQKLAKGTSGQSGQKSTAQLLAEEYKVGEKTIRRDGRFAMIVDQIAENCGDEAKKLILSRDSGLTRGGVARLAKMKPTEQKKYLGGLKKTGQRPRRKPSQKPRTARTLMLPAEPKALVEKLLAKLDAKEAGQVAKLLAEALEKGK